MARDRFRRHLVQPLQLVRRHLLVEGPTIEDGSDRRLAEEQRLRSTLLDAAPVGLVAVAAGEGRTEEHNRDQAQQGVPKEHPGH